MLGVRVPSGVPKRKTQKAFISKAFWVFCCRFIALSQSHFCRIFGLMVVEMVVENLFLPIPVNALPELLLHSLILHESVHDAAGYPAISAHDPRFGHGQNEPGMVHKDKCDQRFHSPNSYNDIQKQNRSCVVLCYSINFISTTHRYFRYKKGRAGYCPHAPCWVTYQPSVGIAW